MHTLARTYALCRVVDDGLDPQRPAVFQVLLDPGVLVEDVDGHAVRRVMTLVLNTPGWRGAGRLRTCAAEDDLDVVRAAEVEVVGDQRLEERPGMARRRSNTMVRETSTWRIDSSHQYPASLVGGGERQREPAPATAAKNTSIVPGCSRSQIACSPAGSSQEANPLDSSVKPMPGLGGLPLGPLVAVDPDLHRVGEVGADLDERRRRTPRPTGRSSSTVTRRSFLAKENCGRLPGSVSRLRAMNTRCGSWATPIAATCDRPVAAAAVQVGLHHLDVAVGSLQLAPPGCDWPRRRRPPPAEGVPDLLQARRGRRSGTRGDSGTGSPARRPASWRHVTVKVEPVQALDVQRQHARRAHRSP